MQNGNAPNGAGPAAPVINVNPVQAAQFALMFLARTDMKPSEREPYAIAEALLNAIVGGHVVLGPAPQAIATAAPASEPTAADSTQ